MSEVRRTKEKVVAAAMLLALGTTCLAGCSSPKENNVPGPVLESRHPWLIDCVAQSPDKWTAVPTKDMNTTIKKAYASVSIVASHLLVSEDQVRRGKSGYVTCDPKQTPIMTTADIAEGAPLFNMQPPFVPGVTEFCAPIDVPTGEPYDKGWNVMLAVCPAATS